MDRLQNKPTAGLTLILGQIGSELFNAVDLHDVDVRALMQQQTDRVIDTC